MSRENQSDSNSPAIRRVVDDAASPERSEPLHLAANAGQVLTRQRRSGGLRRVRAGIADQPGSAADQTDRTMYQRLKASES